MPQLTGGLRSDQLLQLLGSMGVNDPDQLAAILAPTGFVPPTGGPTSSLGQLAQPVQAAAAPPTQEELERSPGEEATPPTIKKPEEEGGFLKALAAIRIPEAPQQPRVPNLGGNVPRGGGTIDPQQLAALLQLLSAGQAGQAQPLPALGGLIAGGIPR